MDDVMESAGRILLMPKGYYTADTSYEMLDLVNHGGASWVCKKDCTGQEPSDSNTEYWQRFGTAVGIANEENAGTVRPDGKTITIDENGIIVASLGYVTPEMYGAVGDGVTNDTDAFVLALESGNPVVCLNKTYLIDSLTLRSNQCLVGVSDSFASTTLKCGGVRLEGGNITLKNVNIKGADSYTGYGLYCCGSNENGTNGGDNHFDKNVVENVNIEYFQYGLYFHGVLWDNIFNNMRIAFCEYGMYKNDDFDCFATVFNNVYFCGSKTQNVYLKKCWFEFNNCNFGVSYIKENGSLLIREGNTLFTHCNFECDQRITSESTGDFDVVRIIYNRTKFEKCGFNMNTDSNIHVLTMAGATEQVLFEQCFYKSVSNNAMTQFINPALHCDYYGALIFDEGCNTIPKQIETEYRFNYTKYPYVIYKDELPCLRIYSADYVDVSKLKTGTMLYNVSDGKYQYYNGTSLIDF